LSKETIEPLESTGTPTKKISTCKRNKEFVARARALQDHDDRMTEALDLYNTFLEEGSTNEIVELRDFRTIVLRSIQKEDLQIFEQLADLVHSLNINQCAPLVPNMQTRPVSVSLAGRPKSFAVTPQRIMKTVSIAEIKRNKENDDEQPTRIAASKTQSETSLADSKPKKPPRSYKWKWIGDAMVLPAKQDATRAIVFTLDRFSGNRSMFKESKLFAMCAYMRLCA
jgi:hypothetical protein